MKREISDRWQKQLKVASDELVDWRSENGQANFGEIENEVDEQLAVVRKQILEDMLLASDSADMRKLEKAKRPKCVNCDVPVSSEGKRSRSLTTDREQVIELIRSYASCPECGMSFFPPG